MSGLNSVVSTFARENGEFIPDETSFMDTAINRSVWIIMNTPLGFSIMSAASALVSSDDILSAVDAIQSEATDFLKTIVAINSTLDKGEGEVQTTIFKLLQETLGSGVDASGAKRKQSNLFDVQRIPVILDKIKDKRGFSPVDWNYDESKFNVVASYQGSGDGTTEGSNKALLLQGHVDVVPAEESDGWSHPPFSPIIKDGRMYGRGSGDMKAGVVAMIYAVIALRRMGYLPRTNLTICTVIEEECTGNGALAANHTSLLPFSETTKTAVIIPEPFEFIVNAQLGVLWFNAKVTGKPCHVLQTSAGSNAIEGAFSLFAALKALEEKYNEPSNMHPAYKRINHPVNFNLGKIEGGNWASSVPSSCRFEARVGFWPGITIEAVKQDIESTLHDEAEKLGLGLEIAYRGFHADGAVLLPDFVDGEASGKKSLQTDFVDSLQKCYQIASADNGSSAGRKLLVKPITCTCDARFYSSLYQNPENVVVTCFGPEADSIHGVDESVSLKSFRDCIVTIALFIQEWCGLEQEETQ
jgi:acetylornithine deacetylase